MLYPATPLLTDLYQLTMLQGYFLNNMHAPAAFELFTRKFRKRNFLIAAGLDQVLTFLESLTFSSDEIDYLQKTGLFRDDFLDWLRELRFEGTVYAMPEGTVFFPNEPVLRVEAPMPQAQLVETRIVNLMHHQILVASKAARCRLVAPEKLLVDFGLRRAHGGEAGLLAARAAYLAGFDGSSNVMAGWLYGMPIYGTMAHSYIMAHDDELEAFRSFARANPENVVLLIDTYDTLEAVEKVIRLAPELEEKGIRIKGVRLDSGDLLELSKAVRKRLDEAGLKPITIFASGDLDEYEIKRLLDGGAPIDGFGVGTRLTTSADLPYLNCAYKLQEYASQPRRKKSTGKQTWPGRKQVYRYYREDGTFDHDFLTLADDTVEEGEPLLELVMLEGKRLHREDPVEIRNRVAEQLQKLPEELKVIDREEHYRVEISPKLQALTEETDRRLGIG